MVYLLGAIARVCNRYMRSGWNGQRGAALAGHHFSLIAIDITEVSLHNWHIVKAICYLPRDAVKFLLRRYSVVSYRLIISEIKRVRGLLTSVILIELRVEC